MNEDFKTAYDKMSELADYLSVLGILSEHTLDPSDNGDCRVCGGDDTVRELDWVTRWNTISDNGENSIVVHQQDPDFETIAFFCYECWTPFRRDSETQIDWT